MEKPSVCAERDRGCAAPLVTFVRFALFPQVCVTMNVLMIVSAVGMSLAIIVLDESERPFLKAWSPPLDRAVRWTQPVGVFMVNGLMLILACTPAG
eukprot:5275811-Prymnesium_polylepis.1